MDQRTPSTDVERLGREPFGAGRAVACFEADDVPWYACDYPERAYELGETLLCGEPCSACLVVAEVELNKLDPLTEDPQNLESWHHIVSVLAGDPDGQ